jgi:transcription antitermination factor NusG
MGKGYINKSNSVLNFRHMQEDDARWYAIYTMYKSEKQVNAHLTRKGIETYLPLITRTRRYLRKIKTYHVPLINCYVFVKINKTEQVKVLETEHVIKFVKQGKDLTHIPQSEIDILRRIEGMDLEVEVSSMTFELGDFVEIKKGSLAGIKGKLIQKLGKKHFVVEIDSIGVSLQLNIDINMLSKIKSISYLTA